MEVKKRDYSNRPFGMVRKWFRWAAAFPFGLAFMAALVPAVVIAIVVGLIAIIIALLVSAVPATAVMIALALAPVEGVNTND